jgi:hypothetical protein
MSGGTHDLNQAWIYVDQLRNKMILNISLFEKMTHEHCIFSKDFQEENKHEWPQRDFSVFALNNGQCHGCIEESARFYDKKGKSGRRNANCFLFLSFICRHKWVRLTWSIDCSIALVHVVLSVHPQYSITFFLPTLWTSSTVAWCCERSTILGIKSSSWTRTWMCFMFIFFSQRPAICFKLASLGFLVVCRSKPEWLGSPWQSPEMSKTIEDVILCLFHKLIWPVQL